MLPVITQGLAEFLPSLPTPLSASLTSLLAALINSSATSPLDPTSRALLVQEMGALNNQINSLPPYQTSPRR